MSIPSVIRLLFRKRCVVPGEKLLTGKVLKADRKTYEIEVTGERLSCTIRGRLVVDGEAVAVKAGDNVRVSRMSATEGVIEEILPRTSYLSRRIESRAYQEQIVAVNIDQLVVVLSTRKPRFKSGLLDRYLVIAEQNGLMALVCINKVDLSSAEAFFKYRDYYAPLGYPVYFTSAVTLEGVAELGEALRGKVSAFVGHSGVGKSSLVTAIDPSLSIRIQSVSQQTRKGLHTTTSAQLYPLNGGGYVVDTPGIRELGFWEIYRDDLQQFFVEIRRLAQGCQFGDCRHIHEPGCAVKQAVENGELFAERYENYVNIFQSLKSAHYD